MVGSRSKKGALAFLFAFSFILNGYASGVPGLSLGSVVFVFLVLYSFVKKSSPTRSNTSLLLIFVFIVISFLDFIIAGNPLDTSFIVKDISKYLIWACMISFGSSYLFDKSEILKWMIRISIVLLVYLVIQYIFFYGLSYYLPNIIEFGPFRAYDSGYASEELGEAFIIRPASFLSESSFLGNFFTVTLIMVLVENEIEYSKKFLRLAIVFTIGIILTSSTSAMIQLPVIWLLLGKNCFKNNKVLSTVSIVALIWGLISIFAVFNTLGDSDNALVYSFFYAFNKFDNLEKSTRFGNSYAFLNYIPESLKILGVGIGNEVAFLKQFVSSDHYYMNSVTLMLVQVGYFGFVLFVLYLVSLVRKSIIYKEKGAIVLIMLYFVHGFGSGMWLGTYGVLFLFVANGYLINAYREKKRSEIKKLLCHTY